MGYRGQQNRDEELRREEAREWAKLPLRDRLAATGSFWLFVLAIVSLFAGAFWRGLAKFVNGSN